MIHVSVAVSEWRSAAMRGSETVRMVMVKPTEKSPASVVQRTHQRSLSPSLIRRTTRSRNSSGHGTTTTSSAPGASMGIRSPRSPDSPTGGNLIGAPEPQGGEPESSATKGRRGGGAHGGWGTPSHRLPRRPSILLTYPSRFAR